MGKRSTARRLAMQILFQLDSGQVRSGLDHLIEMTSDNEHFLPETLEFTKSLINGVLDNLPAIDKIIAERSIGWSLERINNVDRSIMRIAIYEIIIAKSPPSVAINEAVNLAKKFSTAESSKFVNGILGKLVEEQG
jgi:N utilization substance protein B